MADAVNRNVTKWWITNPIYFSINGAYPMVDFVLSSDLIQWSISKNLLLIWLTELIKLFYLIRQYLYWIIYMHSCSGNKINLYYSQNICHHLFQESFGSQKMSLKSSDHWKQLQILLYNIIFFSFRST